MNLGALTTWASQFCGDPNQSRFAGKYTNAINEAQVQFTLDTRALFKDSTFSVVAAQATYALPADFMFEKKVTISTINNDVGGILLTPISRAQLEFYKRSSNWTQDNATPRYYMIDPETARGQLRLYPIPQGSDAGTNNLIMTYYPYPTALAATGDVPLNATGNLIQFHIAIAAYAAWLLLGIEVQTPEIATKRGDLLRQYQNKVTECIDRYGNTASAPLRLVGGRLWR